MTPSVLASVTPAVPTPLEHLALWARDHPASVVAGLLVGAVLAITVTTLIRHWRHARLMCHAHVVRILPPPEVDPSGALTWWATIAAILTPAPWQRAVFGAAHVAWEYSWAGRQATIGVWVPGTVPAATVAAAARAAWPGATTTITPATDVLPPIPTVGEGTTTVVEGGALVAARPTWFPLADRQDTDPTRALMTLASGLHTNEATCVQILIRPASRARLTRARTAAGHATTSTNPASGRTGGLLDPLTWTRALLGVAADLLTPHTTRRRPGQVAAGRPSPASAVHQRQVRAGVDKLTGPHHEIAIRFAAAVAPRTPGPTTPRSSSLLTVSVVADVGGVRRHRG